jgi:hypothetical protein
MLGVRARKSAIRAAKKAQLLPACEICGATEDLCWDHDHALNIFRGTLCERCNFAIGHLQDNPDLCRNAAEYLERFLVRVAS